MNKYKLVSSFYWYQLPQLIQLLDFMSVTDYSITIDEMTRDLGFNLYVLPEVRDSATKIIARAEHLNWFKNNTSKS
jgi:L-rhamnose mutarotase